MPVEKLDFFIAHQIVILAFFEPLSASFIPENGKRKSRGVAFCALSSA